jgi:Ca2+-binding EF-hand superfamily protein
MRKKVLALIFLGGATLCLLMVPTAITFGQQFGGKGGKGGKGGGVGQPGGGFGQPGGGKGGGGGMGNMMADPRMFDWLSKKTPGFIVIADQKMLQDPLQQFANEHGITSGQITREQFATFATWYQDKLASGQISLPNYGGKGGGGPGGGKGNMDPDAMAEQRFKQMDRNGDGFLTEDEMNDKMKVAQPNGEPLWKKFDTNKDGKLDLAEYKAYFKEAVAQWGNNNGGPISGVEGVIMEEEWEKRPVVFRAGKLPKELMPGGVAGWFAQLDTDNDGQVGYYEWRKSGKSYEEFNAMDRNGDGLLTPEEVMWYMKINNPTMGGGSEAMTTAQGPGGPFGVQVPNFGRGPGGPGIGSPFGPGGGRPGGPGGPGKGNGGPGGPGKGNGGPGGGFGKGKGGGFGKGQQQNGG